MVKDKDGAMKAFDPFSDRTSRDIRNALSSALVCEMCGTCDAGVETAVRKWLDKADAEPYRSYILDRREHYHRVLIAIRNDRLRDTRYQALALWNAGLFFEMHELLETIWQGTSGDEREALKGLIQAAGAYVHQLRGKPQAARKLAGRAVANIKKGPRHLAFIGNLDHLIDRLGRLAEPPPRLTPAENHPRD